MPNQRIELFSVARRRKRQPITRQLEAPSYIPYLRSATTIALIRFIDRSDLNLGEVGVSLGFTRRWLYKRAHAGEGIKLEHWVSVLEWLGRSPGEFLDEAKTIAVQLAENDAIVDRLDEAIASFVAGNVPEGLEHELGQVADLSWSDLSVRLSRPGSGK